MSSENRPVVSTDDGLDPNSDLAQMRERNPETGNIYDLDPKFLTQPAQPVATTAATLPSARPGGDAFVQSYTSGIRTPNMPNYPLMKYSADEVGKGLAFDTDRAVTNINENCRETTHYCARAVLNAIDQNGLIRNSIYYAGDAKSISKVLTQDPKLKNLFEVAATGYGNKFDNPDFHPRKGDVVVWEGAAWGHTMMCVGERADHTPIWRCDFTAREGNWTGLGDPNSHGTFKIFRQKTLDTAPLVANNQTPAKPDATKPTTVADATPKTEPAKAKPAAPAAAT